MEEEFLSIRAFAKEINKSHTWVAEKCKEGFITLQNSKVPKYSALEEIKEHGLLENEPKNGRKKTKFPPIVQSKERYEFYRANKMEIDLAILEGKTIWRKEAFEKITEIWKLLTMGYGECAMHSNDFIHGTKRDEIKDKFMELMDENEKIKEAFSLMREIEKKD